MNLKLNKAIITHFIAPTVLVFLNAYIGLGTPAMAAQPEPIKVGIYQNKPKLFVDETNQPAGFFPELLNHIAAKENWTLEYIPCIWNDCLKKIESGTLDLMMDVAYSEERAKRFDFNHEAVISSWSILYIHKGSDIRSIQDVDNKSIAVVKGSIQHRAFKSRTDAFNVHPKFIEKKNFQQILELIDQGKADAGLINRFVGAQNERDYEIERTNILIEPGPLHFAVPKDQNYHLITALDEQLIRLKKKRGSMYYQAMDRWLTPLEQAGFPDWIKWIVGILGLTLFIAFSFVVMLKRQVSIKTLALRRNEKMLRTLIDVNETLLGAENEEELLNRICLNLVEQGGFKLAWVGFAELNDTKSVKVVAEHGFESGYLEGLRIQWGDSEHGQGPTGTTIRTGQPSMNDIQNDPLYEPWREQALSRGFEASIALPLIIEDQVIGALNLYSENPEVLDEEMVELLVEMANDLAFGIRVIRHTKLRFEMESRLRQSEKMDAIGNLAGGIAHDLKNMLFPVLTLTEMIIKDFPKDSRTYQRLEKVLEGGSRAKELVEKIHSLSHIDTVEREVVDLKAALQTTLGLLHSSIPSTVSILIDFPEDQSFIANIEVAQLQTAVMNLASNASDSMDNHIGELHLKLSHILIDDFKLKDISVPTKGNYIELSVRDTGHGMNEETLKKIFQPYFTTKERGEGTGLGMPMVQKFVTEHGGAINISSEVGVGTTVEIYLPLVEKKE